MFERAIRLRRAEKALAEGRWEEALHLASDGAIASHRRAGEIRQKARAQLLGRARERLGGGDRAGAERDLRRAGGDATLHREMLEDEWSGRVEELDEGLHRHGPAWAWTTLEELVARDPRRGDLPDLRAWAAGVGEALCRALAERLAAGDLAPVLSQLARLERGPAAFLTPILAGEVAAWTDALSLAGEGRWEEALALVRGRVRTFPAAQEWATNLERQLSAGSPLPVAGLRMALQGRPAAGAALLAGAGPAARQPVWVRLERALAGEAAALAASLESARSHLSCARPAAALEALARLHGEEVRPQVEALAEKALSQAAEAARWLGVWRAGLAGAVEPAGVVALGEHLARARTLDGEAAGLGEAQELQDGLSKTAEALGRARGAFAGGDPGAALSILEAALPPPRGAWALLREIHGLLGEAAGQVRPGGREVGPLQHARRELGLPPLKDLGGEAPTPGAVAGSLPTGVPAQGFVLRVGGAGDLLVLAQSRLVIGSVAGREADLRILARIGLAHAELQRHLSFHRGAEVKIRSLGGHHLEVEGVPRVEAALTPGVLVQLGPALRFRWERPCPDSLTALLVLQGDFEAEGCRRVAWLKAPGWDGALVLSPEATAHLPVPGAQARLELALDREGRLLARSSEEIFLGGEKAGREAALALGQEIRSGGITAFLDPRRPPA